MRHVFSTILFLLAIASPAWAAVKVEPIVYKVGNTTHKGHIAYDDAQPGKRPGVLVIHEWWGLDDHARNSARKLAEAGYVALAIDMYGEGKQAHHPDDAKKFSAETAQNFPLMEQRFDAAYQFLADHQRVDPKRIAAIGYCFGGAVALNMARTGKDLRGVVAFHGTLQPIPGPAQKGKVKAKVLVLNGTDDPFVPKDQVAAFEKEMKDAGVDYKLVNYPGAKHAFTVPEGTAKGQKFSLPLEYNADADKKSWAEAQAFLARVLK